MVLKNYLYLLPLSSACAVFPLIGGGQMQWWVPGLGVLSSGAPLGHVMVAQEFTTTPGVWVGGSRSPEPLLVSGQVVVICTSPQSLCRHCPDLCEHSHREKSL